MAMHTLRAAGHQERYNQVGEPLRRRYHLASAVAHIVCKRIPHPSIMIATRTQRPSVCTPNLELDCPDPVHRATALQLGKPGLPPNPLVLEKKAQRIKIPARNSNFVKGGAPCKTRKQKALVDCNLGMRENAHATSDLHTTI